MPAADDLPNHAPLDALLDRTRSLPEGGQITQELGQGVEEGADGFHRLSGICE